MTTRLLSALVITLISLVSFADDLPGTKKFTPVISGFLTFGGGKQTGRPNQNPLQDHALEALCENGYSEAIYLYSTNAIEKTVSCNGNELFYHFIDGREPIPIMGRIHQAITNNAGPVYVHCWNGRHASNAIAAIALRQFCGWSIESAKNYWHNHSNGAGSEVEYWSLRRIERYQINSDYNLTSSVQDQVCPEQ